MSQHDLPLIEQSTANRLVPLGDYPSADPYFSGSYSGNLFGIETTTLDDRDNGRFRPAYENEIDLARQRAASRRLAILVGTYSSIMESLRNYTIGKGLDVRVQSEKTVKPLPGVVEDIRRVIDRFLDHNSIPADLDREAHDRSREDGEFLAALCWRGRDIALEILEPDQLREPADTATLREWVQHVSDIDCDSFPTSWTFGVLTDRRLSSIPLGYHVVRDGGGADWDFFPANQFLHIRRNVYRVAKRGVSDYLPVLEDLRKADKLKTNVVTGAALQAAIAWIEEMPAGVTQSQASSLTPADATYPQPTGQGSGGGTRNVNATHYPAGSIVRTSAGRKYVSPPMGQERNGAFEIAAQMALRSIGVRWSIPEYMISGDASNANYSSTMVAESPFVKAREADQSFYCRHWYQCLWNVVRMAHEKGMLPHCQGLTIEQVESQVEILVTLPTVSVRDPLQHRQALAIEVDRGWTAPSTAAAEIGRDLADEIRAGAKPAAVASPFPSALTAAAQGAMESVKSVDDAKAVLDSLWESYP